MIPGDRFQGRQATGRRRHVGCPIEPQGKQAFCSIQRIDQAAIVEFGIDAGAQEQGQPQTAPDALGQRIRARCRRVSGTSAHKHGIDGGEIGRLDFVERF